jgi:hypothetical protein
MSHEASHPAGARSEEAAFRPLFYVALGLMAGLVLAGAPGSRPAASGGATVVPPSIDAAGLPPVEDWHGNVRRSIRPAH